jgi:hypothetical protein
MYIAWNVNVMSIIQYKPIYLFYVVVGCGLFPGGRT